MHWARMSVGVCESMWGQGAVRTCRGVSSHPGGFRTGCVHWSPQGVRGETGPQAVGTLSHRHGFHCWERRSPSRAPSEFSLALGPRPFESIWKVLWEAGPCGKVHRAWTRAGAWAKCWLRHQNKLSEGGNRESLF